MTIVTEEPVESRCKLVWAFTARPKILDVWSNLLVDNRLSKGVFTPHRLYRYLYCLTLFADMKP